MSDIVQSRIHGGCSSTICYCFAAVKAKAALAGTGRTIEQTLLLYGCISLLLFSLVVFPYICMYICITDKYFNVWERYIKEKKVSDIQMALGINHFMALRFSVCRKESGLSSPRTRQQSPTKLCLRKLHPADPVQFLFSSDLIQLQFQFPKTAVGNLSGLVQSTLLQDDEPGNFQKRKDSLCSISSMAD